MWFWSSFLNCVSLRSHKDAVMEQEVMFRRNALFDLIYRRIVESYAVYVPTTLQWIMEMTLLLLAAAVLALWGYIHFSYIMYPGDCLEQITKRPFPYDVILQVEAFTNSTPLWRRRELAIAELYQSIQEHEIKFNTADRKQLQTEQSSLTEDSAMEQGLHSQICNFLAVFGLQLFCNSSVPDLSQGSEFEDTNASSHLVEPLVAEHQHDNNDSADAQDQFPQERLDQKEEAELHTPTNVTQDMTALGGTHSLYELLDFYSLKRLAFDYTILEFAQEPGYLSLTHSSRTKLNITVVKVYIDPENSTCFGGQFGYFISKYLLGYEMMIIASFKDLLPAGQGTGYVMNLLTGSHYYYRVQWMGKWRYGAGLLPAMFFTLVASVLLRQIHHHVFTFITHFQHLLNQGVPMPVHIGAQIPFLIVTYAAIGLIIVMSEALSDDSVFSLLMVTTVWEADQYYAVFCRQEASKKYFPWFFYLYHFLPYAYYIRFNGQFWFIPFLFHWLLLQHIMLFFMHHLEIPAFTLPHAVQHLRAGEPQIQEENHQNLVREDPAGRDHVEIEEQMGDQTSSPRQLDQAGLHHRSIDRSTDSQTTREHSINRIQPFSTQECSADGPSVLVSGSVNQLPLRSNSPPPRSRLLNFEHVQQ